MKVIALIEARQDDVIRKILQHCGLWHDPPPRAPPKPPRPARPVPARPPSHSFHAGEIDPDFLEHLHRESLAEQLELPWE